MIRWILSWILFWLGHFVFIVTEAFFKEGMNWHIYNVYNKLMTASDIVQGSGKGPWKNVA